MEVKKGEDGSHGNQKEFEDEVECSVLLNNQLEKEVKDQRSDVKVNEKESDDFNCNRKEASDSLINACVEDDVEENPAPDGGWGWFIVLGSMMVHLFMGGVERSAGIIFLKFHERFQQSAAVTAWATSVPSGLRLVLGPVCSMMNNRFSCRTVVIFGSILFSISMVITAFSTDLPFVFVSFSVLGGVARCFAYAPAVVIVGQYFNKRRGLAVGMSTSGIGFGSFFFPTLIEFIFTHYGFFGTFLILGGIVLNMCVSGSLFRPLWVHVKMNSYRKRKKNVNRKEIGTESKLVSPILGCKTEINHVTYTSSEEVTITKTKRSKFMKRVSCAYEKSQGKPESKLLELSLLKDLRFATFCIAILLFTFAYQSAFVFIPAYAKQNEMDDLQATYVVTIAGCFDGIGRVLSGIILDLKHVKRYRIYVYNAIMFLVGTVSFIVPQVHTFEELSIVCAVYGLLVGTYVSQKSVVIVDILGVKKLVNSFGILICFQGVGMFLGPPISGLLKDINGHFNDGFYFGGTCMILGAFILVAANITHYFKMKKTRL